MIDIGLTTLSKGIVLDILEDSILIEDMNTKKEVEIKVDSFVVEHLREVDGPSIITYDTVKKVLI